MTVNADFTTLTNNSRITVANGPLIAADGAGTKLWITGNLLNFLTASGNQVVVTNSIAPNMSGNSVDGVTAKGNVVFAGDTPVIKNLSSNSVPSLNSSTTTMINATNGAKVCVKTGSC